jgi:hypothetical protein
MRKFLLENKEMQYFILILTSMIFSIVILLGLFKYNSHNLTKKSIAVQSAYEILDQILHHDPAFPESSWNKFLSKLIDKIDLNGPDNIVSMLRDQTSLPLRISFFALYFNIKRVCKGKQSVINSPSRKVLREFARGGIINVTDQEIADILNCALEGLYWMSESESRLNGCFDFQFELQFLLSKGAHARAILSPNYSTG